MKHAVFASAGVVLAAGTALLVCASSSYANRNGLPRILRAIQRVESGDSAVVRDGDSGRAVGPFQIWKEYWYDATHTADGRKIHPGRYRDCRNPQYARQVVIWYWQRYCPDELRAMDFQTLARTHNGGLNGPDNRRTVKYWHRVQSVLKRQS